MSTVKSRDNDTPSGKKAEIKQTSPHPAIENDTESLKTHGMTYVIHMGLKPLEWLSVSGLFTSLRKKPISCQNPAHTQSSSFKEKVLFLSVRMLETERGDRGSLRVFTLTWIESSCLV